MGLSAGSTKAEVCGKYGVYVVEAMGYDDRSDNSPRREVGMAVLGAAVMEHDTELSKSEGKSPLIQCCSR